MYRNIALGSLVCSLLLLSAPAVFAQDQAEASSAVTPTTTVADSSASAVPRWIKFSGVIAGNDANQARTESSASLAAADKTVALRFAIYDQQDATEPLWQETQTVRVNSAGHYSVLLGSTAATGLPAEMFSSSAARWVGVNVNGQSKEEQPRTLLVSVPYALKALDAETIGGKAPSSFVTSEQLAAAVQAESPDKTNQLLKRQLQSKIAGVSGPVSNNTGTANYIPKFQDASTLVNSALYQNAAGNVGVGTSNPLSTFHIQGPNAEELGQTQINGAFVVQGAGTFAGAIGTKDDGTFGNQYLWIQSRYADSAVYRNLVLNPSGGNVGIGVRRPIAALHVQGPNAEELGQAKINGALVIQGAGTFAGAIGTKDDGSPGTQYLWIQSRYADSPVYRNLVLNPSGGNVGIGVRIPRAVLDVAGPAIVHGTLNTSGNVTGTGNAFFTGTVSASHGVLGQGDQEFMTGDPNAVGVKGIVFNSVGTAGVLENDGGGKLLSGRNSAAEVFSVNGDGSVAVDASDTNPGTLLPGLTFGHGSGEGIASQRSGGGANLFGLDFYTEFVKRMSIAQNGDVSVFGVLNGNGSGLTALNASSLTGIVPENRLSSNVAFLNRSQTFTQDIGIDGTLSTGGGVNVHTTLTAAGATFNGNSSTAAVQAIQSGAGTALAGSANDGTGVSGNASTGTGVSGVVASMAGTAGLFINNGGGKVLSGKNSTAEVFSVNGDGSVAVDASDANDGSHLSPGGLSFGHGSGEGIASYRKAGTVSSDFLFDLDFYTNFLSRMIIFHDGRVAVLGNLSVDGDLHVNGTVSKGGGSFKIDHPLDPENKYLSHSFVESPDMMNVYNGVIVLDKHGRAWVSLPDYFEALNRDFRYQLTAIGAPGPNLYIGSKVSGNRFQIAGGRPGGEVSWQVTGVRHDAYANAHRIPTEEMKPAGEIGHYLHPGAFKTEDRGIAVRNAAIGTK